MALITVVGGGGGGGLYPCGGVCLLLRWGMALLYRGSHGASLVWLFYLLMAYALHIIVLLTALVIACKSTRNRLLLVMLTVVMIVLFLAFIVLFTG